MAANRVLKLTNAGEIEFFEPSAGGTSYVAVKAPALAASWSLTLPPDDGAADSILRSDGSGVTTWVTSLTSFGVTSLTVTDLIVNDEVRVTEPGGPSYVSIVAPALAATYTLTLPPTDGNNDELLRTDGAGTTTWVNTVTAFDVDALTSDGITVLNHGSLALREAVAGGASAVILQAPAALVGDVTLTLPPTDGAAADELLRTDGAGVLTFVNTVTAFDIDALTSDGITILNEGLLVLREATAHGANEVTFKAPHDLANDTDYTLPAAIVGGNFLQTDAAGQLSWAASASTLQTAYDAGHHIVEAAGDTIEISQGNNSGMLSLLKTGGGAGDVLALHNDGTGRALGIQQDGAAYAVEISQNAASYSMVIWQNGAQNAFYISQATDNDVMLINKTGANAGVMLNIHNDGTGNDMSSVHGGWSMTAGGGLSLNGLRFIHDHLTVTAGVMAVDINDGYVTVASHDANPEFIDTINGGTDGQILIIRLLTGSANITARHNVGNLHLDGGANFGFDDSHDMLMLIYESTSGDWCEISRSNNG